MKKGEIMELLVRTIGRDKQYMAEGIFLDQGFIVKKGGKVAELKAVKQVPEYVRNMRCDKSIVSDDTIKYTGKKDYRRIKKLLWK